MITLVQATIGRALRLTMRPMRVGPHVTRYSMYRRLETRRFKAAEGASVLSISDSESLCRRLGLDPEETQLTRADYPEFNLLTLPFPDSSFDYVVADQVLEHVEGDPYQAMSESVRVLKPGGFLVHTTCFINPIHGFPSDFWRFTPGALSLLCRASGAEVVECGGWGNPYVWVVSWLGLRFQGVPEAAWHPLRWVAVHNDPEWPVATWVIARRPACHAHAAQGRR